MIFFLLPRAKARDKCLQHAGTKQSCSIVNDTETEISFQSVLSFMIFKAPKTSKSEYERQRLYAIIILYSMQNWSYRHKLIKRR